MNDEAGWLIEIKFGDDLLWWSGEFDRANNDYQRARLIARMVNDAGKAVRFARREDAQRVLDGMFSARPCPIFGNAPTLYSVQEHMWPAPSQPGQQPPQPINMVLHCPKCGEQHIDKADAWWNNPPHRSHLCHGCGHIWRPADVPTNGVAAIKTHGTNDSAIAQPPQAEQAAQAVAQEPRVCWLVEEFSNSGNSTGRYMLDQSDLTITTDVQKARQFRRSRTATFRATDMREKWGTAWRPVSHVFWVAQPQQAEPTRSQKMRDAGFTPRDTRLECDECGQKVTAQFMPIHKCAQQAAQRVAPRPTHWMDDRGLHVTDKWLRSDAATSDYREAYNIPARITKNGVEALAAAQPQQAPTQESRNDRPHQSRSGGA